MDTQDESSRKQISAAHLAGVGSGEFHPKSLVDIEKFNQDYLVKRHASPGRIPAEELNALLAKFSTLWPEKIKRSEDYKEMLGSKAHASEVHQLLNGRVIEAVDESSLRRFFKQWRKLELTVGAPPFMPALADYYDQSRRPAALLRFKKDMRDLKKTYPDKVPDISDKEGYDDYVTSVQTIVSDYLAATDGRASSIQTEQDMLDLGRDPPAWRGKDVIDEREDKLLKHYEKLHPHLLLQAYGRDWAAMTEEQRTTLDTAPEYKPLKKLLYIARWGELAEQLQDQQHSKFLKLFGEGSKGKER